MYKRRSMQKKYSIAETRTNLSQLPNLFKEIPDLSVVQVTRRGLPVLAVLDWERFQAVMETLDILSDEETTAKLKKAIREIEVGVHSDWSPELETL